MPTEAATQPTRTAEVMPVFEEDLDRQFGFVEVIEEPRTRSGGEQSTRGCIVRECCSSGDIYVCERGNDGQCGESNFCQEYNTGDCDRVNGCRNVNDGSCGQANLCNAPNS